MSTETSATRWTVQERTWKQELPGLPDDVIALLAPPVVVSASVWTAPAAPPPPPAAAPLSPAVPVRNVRRRTAGRPVPRAAARVA